MNSYMFLVSTLFLAAYSPVNSQTPTNVISGNVEKNRNGDAISGFTNITNSVDYTAQQNVAIARDGTAVSGGRGFLGAAYNVDSDITTNATKNVAQSNQGTAVSGSQLVAGNVTGGSVNEEVTVTDNKAGVVGAKVSGESNPTAIAGADRQIAILDDSVFTQNNAAQNNVAINENEGKSVGGLLTSLGSVTDSYVQSDVDATKNLASSKQGPAIAGAQINLATVTDSTINATSDTSYNQAFTKEGNAVSGSSSNFGSIEGTFPSGGVQVDIDATATRNIAKSQGDGKAVSGVETNIASATRADIDIEADASQNLAIVEGESELPKNAVAGFAVNIGTLDDTPLDVDVSTYNNYAFNYHSDTGYNKSNNAIAGANFVIGEIKDSAVVIDANSTNNYAYAINGDAIAGNKVFVGKSDAESSVSLDLNGSGNEAVSVNGDAIMDNEVNIGGDAAKFYP